MACRASHRSRSTSWRSIPLRIIDDGLADGLYSTPVPLQIFAYRTPQLPLVHADAHRLGRRHLLGGRILELRPHPERPAGRVPTLHAVAEARLDHRRGRGLPPRRRRQQYDESKHR